MNPYIEQIGRTHPGVEADAIGPLYSDVIFRRGGPISKAALDAEIASFIPRSRNPLTADELADQLVIDGTMTRASIDAIKVSR